VFGKVVDSHTMTESVRDEITVRIVYEGRAAKVALHNSEFSIGLISLFSLSVSSMPSSATLTSAHSGFNAMTFL
jgi:type I site-specific restriction-modification system R (restriction) subunit